MLCVTAYAAIVPGDPFSSMSPQFSQCIEYVCIRVFPFRSVGM